jgi:acetyltransferase-like isoleucine patch superfamily enzyme
MEVTDTNSTLYENIKYYLCTAHDNGTGGASGAGFYLYVWSDGPIVEAPTFHNCEAYRNSDAGLYVRTQTSTASVGVRNITLRVFEAHDQERHGVYIAGNVDGGVLDSVIARNNDTLSGGKSNIHIGEYGHASQGVTDLLLTNIISDNCTAGYGLYLDTESHSCTLIGLEAHNNTTYDLYVDGTDHSIGHYDADTVFIENTAVTLSESAASYHPGFQSAGSLLPSIRGGSFTTPSIGSTLQRWTRVWCDDITVTNGIGEALLGFTGPGGETTLTEHIQSSGIHQVGDFANLNTPNTFSSELVQTFQGPVVLRQPTWQAAPKVTMSVSGGIEFFDVSGNLAGSILVQNVYDEAKKKTTPALTFIDANRQQAAAIGGLEVGFQHLTPSGATGSGLPFIIKAYRSPSLYFKDTYVAQEHATRDYAMRTNAPAAGGFEFRASTVASGDALEMSSSVPIITVNRTSANYHMGIGPEFTAANPPTAHLHIDGSQAWDIYYTNIGQSVSGDDTVYYCSGNLILNLPTPVGKDGRIFVIKQIANGTVDLQTAAGRIENNATYQGLDASGKCVTVQAWNGNYYIIGGYGI